MKKLFVLLGLIGLIFMYSCNNDDPSYDELKKEVEELKALLDKNISIEEVSFEGSDIILKFANGKTLRSTAPESIIPQIGEDGCWCVNGESLGIKATPEIPTVGADGYWYVGDTKTDVKAQGDKGDTGAAGNDGSDGADGNGIKSIEYDDSTGILKITLDDNTVKEFLLFTEEQQLKARKLGDLNGKYLIESIWGGDMKFMGIEYDDQNRIVKVNSFKNVFNQAVKYASVIREYEGDKISKATFEMYAEVDKTIKEKEYINCLDNEPVFFENKTDKYFQDTENANYIYVFINKAANGSYYIRVPKATNDNYIVTKEGENLYIWKNDNSLEIQVEGNSEPTKIYYCTDKYPLIEEKDTVNIDDNGVKYYYNEITNYNNPDNIDDTKKYFQLYKKRYIKNYTKGDKMMSYSLNYIYNGSDPFVYLPIRNEYHLSVVMDDKKMDKIYLSIHDEPMEIINFHYNSDGLLSHLSSPYVEADSIAEFQYDGQNNPVSMNIHSKRLKDAGIPNKILAMLGLAYAYEEYDSSTNETEDKYIYPEGYAPMIKMNYDYKMKNFLGHTFRALCPIWQGFSQTHAMEELIWAGHASGMTAEYRKFNEGGYPTEIKGYLRIGAGDAASIAGEMDALDEDITRNLPNIGVQIEPIATCIKLKYKKIEETPSED